MRLLFIHSDHLTFETTDTAGPDGLAETEGVPMSGEMEECVTAFLTVESDDENDLDGVVQNAVSELEDVTGQLNTHNIVLYPYAHLSEDLASPDAAKTVMRSLETELEAKNYEILRAPFGWYKSFEISCKGHPLSELSRHVTSHHGDVEGDGEDEPEDEDEEREPSEWHLLTPEGDLEDPLERKTGVSEDMQAFIEDEVEGVTASKGEEPAHLSLMQEKELVDYDPLSDVGNLRYYPRGKFVRDSLMEYVNDLVVDYGGMPVETPIMYDLGVRAIDEHAGKFGERQYRFESGNRKMMLRFAACFGQFSIMRDMFISENDLPLRVYEMSTYSFRREQKGEVMGLKRQRAFTMPDMHTATADIEQAKDEFQAQANLSLESSSDLGLNYVVAFRLTEEFFDDHREWVEEVVADIDEPVLLEVLPERHHYWSAKIDLAAIDALGRPIENPTVQIDVESAERFDITYNTGESSHNPIILHYSPSGGIERVMAALLEQTARQETASLPTWLSPTQVRFIPVGDEHVDFCDELVDELTESGIRADIDERNESVGKRIATAETDWVPYYAVVGDDEVDDPVFGINLRGEDDEREMNLEELAAAVLDDVDQKPNKKRYLPRYISDHPNFT
ncbi:threonine--tRNA ligase [Natrarchaeobius halalkaliphilus]|uniref:Threonine--tRNA ligase n=1 Tax=Natrarchaeobius halalkaliphilus TaxID=1679091 RepID=A0A3N6LY23_9EURY|nr:threonine--tRNA ligase [Natrarchaeobius halalkaliphilus]RQG92734.1 threonine--tRNA ligase [Natrarchaeobius halalkaliphilus]